MGSIRETLENIGAISSDNVSIFATRTRDMEIPVYRDEVTGVIFIDDFYVGNMEYKRAKYREVDQCSSDDQDSIDTRRRLLELRQFVVGKRVLEFGFGSGRFLREARQLASRVHGVELDENALQSLKDAGVSCSDSIDEITDTFDTALLFHVVEHLPDPVETLRQVRERLKPNVGVCVVEVPNARNLLLNELCSEEFTQFTLWSQHLVLHTRDSLSRLIYAAGFAKVTIRGVQRYSISNHLSWLRDGKPGGHKRPLSIMETDPLRREYALALAAIDATDTLVAVAHL